MVNTRVRTGAILAGIGLGALADGIVFRELLQWNSMLSSVLVQDSLEAVRVSLAADGVFDAIAWVLVAIGVAALWSAFGKPGSLPSTKAFCGYLLLGWGWFNLVEGLVNHELLGLHHLHDLPAYVPAYDWGYLLIGGAGFIAAGILFARKPSPRSLGDRRAGLERRGTGSALHT